MFSSTLQEPLLSHCFAVKHGRLQNVINSHQGLVFLVSTTFIFRTLIDVKDPVDEGDPCLLSPLLQEWSYDRPFLLSNLGLLDPNSRQNES